MEGEEMKKTESVAEPVEQPQNDSSMKMPQMSNSVAIVIAGGLIAIAIFLSGGGTAQPAPTTGDPLENAGSALAEKARPVDQTDHIFGNPDAKVTIIEYSDFECPFCARFHPTVAQLLQEFDGEVRWVYRHFPLTSIHPDAAPAALASECVAQKAGEVAFWNFANDLFVNQGALGDALYAQLGSQYGLTEADFAACFEDTELQARVERDLTEAVAAGGRGTPYSIIITAKGERVPFSGALPIEQVRPLIEAALKN